MSELFLKIWGYQLEVCGPVVTDPEPAIAARTAPEWAVNSNWSGSSDRNVVSVHHHEDGLGWAAAFEVVTSPEIITVFCNVSFSSLAGWSGFPDGADPEAVVRAHLASNPDLAVSGGAMEGLMPDDAILDGLDTRLVVVGAFPDREEALSTIHIFDSSVWINVDGSWEVEE